MRGSERQRGVTLVAALGMMAVVGVALAAVAAHFRFDARRTRQAGADMQVRQLLVAGQAFAAARLAAGDAAGTVEVAVPQVDQNLPFARLTLAFDPAVPGKVVVTAAAGDRRGRQVLQYEGEGGARRLVAAELTR